MSRVGHLSARKFERPRTDDGWLGNHDRLCELGPHARRKIIFVSAIESRRAGTDRRRRRGKSGRLAIASEAEKLSRILPQSTQRTRRRQSISLISVNSVISVVKLLLV